MEWELICRSYVVKLGKSIGIGIEVLVFGPVLVLVLVLTLRHSRVLVLVLSIDLGQMGVLVLVLGIGLSQIGVLVLVLSIGLSQILVLVLVLRYEYWYCWCLVSVILTVPCVKFMTAAVGPMRAMPPFQLFSSKSDLCEHHRHQTHCRNRVRSAVCIKLGMNEICGVRLPLNTHYRHTYMKLQS